MVSVLLSGPEALAALEGALADLRGEEDDVTRKLARSAERVVKAGETEGELLAQLAAIEGGPEAKTALAAALGPAQKSARNAVGAHLLALKSVASDLNAYDARLAKLSAEREAVAAQMLTSQNGLQKLITRIETEIGADPAFAAQTRHVKTLRAIAEAARLKIAQSEAAREQKGRPFRDDKLFSYLWAAQFGTETYGRRGLVRFLDGYLAGLIAYPKWQAIYRLGMQIPERLVQHAAHTRNEAEAGQAKLDQLERQAIDTAGGKPLREAVSAARARLAAIDTAMTQVQDQRNGAAATQADLVTGADPEFDAALAGMNAALAGPAAETLLRSARVSANEACAAIVAQIEDIRSRTREETADTGEQRGRLATLAARRRALEDIEYEFKQAGFDDPRARFNEPGLIGAQLDAFLVGEINAGQYWRAWRRAHSWSTDTSSWGSGLGLPGNGRMAPPRPEALQEDAENVWQTIRDEEADGTAFSRPRRTG